MTKKRKFSKKIADLLILNRKEKEVHAPYCLMVSGGSLTKLMRETLFQTAGKMVQNQEKHGKVLTDDFAGFVQTDFNWSGIGDIYGIVFYAELDLPEGSTKVSYIIRTQDLEAALRQGLFWPDNYAEFAASCLSRN